MNRQAIISVGIFGFLLLLTLVTHQENVKVGIHDMHLPDLDGSKVSALKITGKVQVDLKKHDGHWWVSGKDFTDKRADDAAVKQMLDGLSDLKIGHFITARPEKHADLDVDATKGSHVTLQAGKVKFAATFGRSAKNGGNYIQLKGKNDTYIALGSFGNAVRRNAESWR